MTLKQIFVQNLREFRKKEGLSQMKLAIYLRHVADCKVNNSAISI